MKYLLSSSLIISLLVNGINCRWRPLQGDTWNYVLEGKVDLSNEPASVVDIDYKTDSETIKKIHDAGKKVICYFSGGTLENFRLDKSKFYAVSGLVRNAYEAWAGENWLDIRKEGLKPLMKSRMQEAIDKKCDALEVDNLDGWQQDEVQSWSSPLTKQDTIKYAKWLGSTAHELGISIGLKNGLFMINEVADYFDFAINESCATLSHPECNLYKNFLNKGKAVLGISYQTYLDYDYDKLCKNLNGLGISMIIKETQTLKQAGSIFDAKKHCGSNFSQPFIKSSSSDDSSSNDDAPKQEPVKTTTTVIKTTTTVVKTTTTVKPITTIKKVDEIPVVIKSTTTTVKPIITTPRVVVKPTTTTTTVKPITTDPVIFKPNIIKQTTTVKPQIVKQTTVKPISNVTFKPIMTAKQAPSIDIIATTTIKVAATEEPYVINKTANNARPSVNQDMPNYKSDMPLNNNNNYNNYNAHTQNNYDASVRNNGQEESFKEAKKQYTGKDTSNITKTVRVKPTTSFEEVKGQNTKIETQQGQDAMIEAQQGQDAMIEAQKEKETKVDDIEENEKLDSTKMEDKENTNTDNTKATSKSKSKSNADEKKKEVNGVNEESSGTGTTVVVAAGSVAGAAGVFLLIKKNPKKYQSLKRGLSRRATSVRRSASTISRRLTTSKKAKNSNESLNQSYSNSLNNSFNDNIDISVNSNYRYNFSQI